MYLQEHKKSTQRGAAGETEMGSSVKRPQASPSIIGQNLRK